MAQQFLRSIALAVACVLGVFASAPVFADRVVVKRHVTLRDAPSKKAAVVAFPEIDASFTLLDDGARNHGYYHVQYAERTAWVYYTFVERVADAAVPPQVGLVPLARGTMAVHYINVDQAASALLEFSCGAILIDAGGRVASDGDRLIAYLDAFFARRPDLNRTLATIFVTHTHIDHNFTLRRVVERYRVDGYVHNGVLKGSGSPNANWMATYAPTASPPIPAIGITEAMVEAAGPSGLTNATIDPVACTDTDPQLHVLSGSYAINPGWPAADFAKNGNYQSLVIRVDFGRSSFLFTGDMEDKALDTLLHRYQGTHALDADVYTVGHHGSYNGTTQALLDAVTPKIAVMSAGNSTITEQWTAWAYGHPRKQAVDMLASSVSLARTVPATVQVADAVHRFSPYRMTRAVYSTSWDGNITVDADANGTLSVELGK